ncbi:RNA polymerase sigma factor [Roseivirga sp. E12]|uniref:RNA polymerase sigma factor n=1 Tax=Roseivirga sp. E12 TaxID=2819237 RepID=UPI001ABCF356|nr:RNA polymerase sigma factor [Roseivirga sp. E12]MBO3698629.1 RNA polymerase sigma factor [Roseivirga sp. E12]
MTKRRESGSLNFKLNLLVLRCQAGNEPAFRDLYERFSQSTLVFLENLTNREVAQDLNQEVWLNVYRQLANLSDTRRFKTWLFQIARNRALDYFKSTKRLREFHEMLKPDMDELTELMLEEIDFKREDILQNSLDGLSTKLREVIILNFFEGMDYSEIAFILGCSLGTVKSRIYNGKLKIKELLETKMKKS